jgi:hypothetical protein
MSENLQPQIAAHPHLQIAGEAPLTFDEDGRMTSPWCL